MLSNDQLLDGSESLTLNDTNSSISTRYVNSATEEESVAIEALSQLGSALINTKIAEDLSLLTCDTESKSNAFYTHAEETHSYREVEILDECILPVLCNTWDDYELIQVDDFNNVAQELTVETSTDNSEGTVCDSDIDVKPKTCNICFKSFSREAALLSHLKLHSRQNSDRSISDDEENWEKVKSIRCSLCDKCFPTKQKLHRHMWVHRKNRFTCEICATCFEREAELQEHRLVSHQGTTAYFCYECGKCFSSRQGLWEHNRVHGSSPKMYKCIDCVKTFTSRQGYLIHKRKHSDERPFECSFCCKAFRDGGTLRKHEGIHTGERPHECPLCSRDFNQKVVLREHIRWLHTANWKPLETDGFKCSLCDIVLDDRDDLCAHIVKHSDTNALRVKNQFVKPASEIVKSDYKCDLCNQEFLSKKCLTEHAHTHI